CGSQRVPDADGSVPDASNDAHVDLDGSTEDCRGMPLGTPCGDPTESECDAPDTCDGLGACLPNFAPVETPCGDPDETACDAPDTCDGDGQCAPNLAPADTPCGAPPVLACDAI